MLDKTENSFEKLRVWQLSHQLTLEIYKITKTFPLEEKYSLVDQIKRSSSSIPTNIVEGNETGKMISSLITYLKSNIHHL